MPENVCRLSLRGMSPSIFDPYFLALERTPAVLRAWSGASRAFLPAREANSSIVPTTMTPHIPNISLSIAVTYLLVVDHANLRALSSVIQQPARATVR